MCILSMVLGWHLWFCAMKPSPEIQGKLYDLVGPFVVETEGNPYLASQRCWLASDPERKVIFEGTSREMGEYFEAMCRDLYR